MPTCWYIHITDFLNHMTLLVLHLEHYMQFEAPLCCWTWRFLEEMSKSGWKGSFTQEKKNICMYIYIYICIYIYIYLKGRTWWWEDKIQNSHPSVHLEKRMIKEIEADIINNNMIHFLKTKNRYYQTSQTNVFPTIKFIHIMLDLIASIV